jgi:polysaccharide biosynthesis protein PslH
MKILWLSHVVPYPPKAGVLLRAYYLLRAVAQRHELDLVAFIQEPLLRTFYGTLPAALEDCRRELEKMCRSVTFLPIEKLHRPLGKVATALESLLLGRGYTVRWLDGHHARRTLTDIAKSKSFDIVHFDSESLACFRPIFDRIPATLGHHNAEADMMRRRAQNESSLARKIYFSREARALRKYERAIARDYIAHITCSDLDSERLRLNMPGARFVTIPNGVDIEYFKPSGRAQEPHSLIFVSSMNWYPNVDAVLFLLRDIWPRIRSRCPEARLDIVGASAPPSVIALARSLPSVKLHGFVPDIRPLMEGATLYICPVRDGGGTKLKVLDALAMQKCVIAHPIACEGISVTPEVDIVVASRPEEFAQQVEALLGDAARRTAIESAARKLAVTHYSFEAIGSRLATLFEELGNEPGRSLKAPDSSPAP